MEAKTEQIRTLNDRLRQNFSEGTAVMTTGVAALGAEAVARIVKTIAVYDDFCHANDPYEEHDFGSFEADGHTIFFKIDHYDRTMTGHSPDPADPAVTQRVITIMRCPRNTDAGGALTRVMAYISVQADQYRLMLIGGPDPLPIDRPELLFRILRCGRMAIASAR